MRGGCVLWTGLCEHRPRTGRPFRAAPWRLRTRPTSFAFATELAPERVPSPRPKLRTTTCFRAEATILGGGWTPRRKRFSRARTATCAVCTRSRGARCQLQLESKPGSRRVNAARGCIATSPGVKRWTHTPCELTRAPHRRCGCGSARSRLAAVHRVGAVVHDAHAGRRGRLAGHHVARRLRWRGLPRRATNHVCRRVRRPPQWRRQGRCQARPWEAWASLRPKRPRADGRGVGGAGTRPHVAALAADLSADDAAGQTHAAVVPGKRKVPRRDLGRHGATEGEHGDEDGVWRQITLDPAKIPCTRGFATASQPCTLTPRCRNDRSRSRPRRRSMTPERLTRGSSRCSSARGNGAADGTRNAAEVEGIGEALASAATSTRRGARGVRQPRVGATPRVEALYKIPAPLTTTAARRTSLLRADAGRFHRAPSHHRRGHPRIAAPRRPCWSRCGPRSPRTLSACMSSSCA